MQIDKAPFLVHTLELNNPKILIRSDQAEGAKGKNVVIGNPRPMNANDKTLSREVVKEKTNDGRDTLKITIIDPSLGGRGSSPPDSRSAAQARLVRPVPPTSPTCQTSSSSQSDRPSDRPSTFKPKHREVGTLEDQRGEGAGKSC